MRKVQVARWGNSTAVRLPKEIVETLGLRPGMLLDIGVQNGLIRLGTPPKTSRDRLAEMVAEARRLGAENEPETVGWGPDRGSEVIDDDDPR